MERVLFLGAGFSAPFGHPVMDAFLPFADSTPFLTDDDKNCLGRLLLDARSANSFLESSPTNLEDILSYAVMADRLGLRDNGPVTPRVCEILRKIYGRVSDLKQFWQRCDALRKFLRVEVGDRCEGLSIVTTNYDLNIDCSLRRIGTRPTIGFDYRPVDPQGKNVVSRLYGTGGVRLFKLHGSVNWFRTDDPEELAVDDQVGTVNDFGGPPSQLECLLVHSTKYTPPSTPLIVPPSFLKPDLSPILSKVWAGAAQVLRTAHEVVFVGYSFPPSDTEMTYFLAHAMAANSHIRRIIVVDLDAKKIVERLRGPSSRYGSHFKALLVPQEGSWTDVQLRAVDAAYSR